MPVSGNDKNLALSLAAQEAKKFFQADESLQDIVSRQRNVHSLLRTAGLDPTADTSWDSIGFPAYSSRIGRLAILGLAFDAARFLDGEPDQVKALFTVNMALDLLRQREKTFAGEAPLWEEFRTALSQTAYLELAQANLQRNDAKTAAAYLTQVFAPK